MKPVRNEAQLRVHLLGRLRMEREGEPVALPTRKASGLLAYLLLHAGAHAREKLAALYWPDVPDASARASLRNGLSTLRRHLGRGLLRADRETVEINPAYPVWVDALAFRRQAREFLAAPVPDPTAVNLALYEGDLLADFYEDWVLREREAFRSLYIEVLLALTQQMRAQSEYEQAMAFAEQAIAHDRAQERAHQHLMFCHVALGQRDTALRQYEACRQALSEELAVEPSPATKKLQEWIRQAPAEKMPVEASLTNLPIPLSSFIGRQDAMTAVKERLASGRLVTLTGAGGSGKTRLAIQVATDLLDAYRDGVWWVELAAVGEAELVPQTVAKALGVPEVPNQPASETLTNFLRARQLLLVLDNCEHLVRACARLAERLLSECAQVKILATSREMLGIHGEQVWPVPTLAVPEPDHLPAVEKFGQYEAIRLFVERAGAVRPDFTLTGENAPPVAEICARVDGLPLAIELAAARTKVLTAGQIAARLEDALHLLADGSRTGPPRHRTLRAAIEWSVELLSQKERMLLRRLSVFTSGWTLPAAEAICAGEGIAEHEVFDLLSGLVEKSLVEVQTGGTEARYRLLETIRRYSSERLREAGEAAGVRYRHLMYFRQLAEAANPHLGFFLADANIARWRGRLEPEHDNVRAAMQWILESEAEDQGRVEAGLRLAGNLHWYWFARGRFAEGRAWLARLLESGDEVPVAIRAQALLTAGYLACWQGAFSAGRAPLEEALTLFRRLENGRGIAFALHGLGFVAMGEGDGRLSRSRFEASLSGAREVDDKWIASFALHFLAIVLSYQGEYALAAAHFEEGDALLRQMGGHKQGLAFSQFHLGRIARLQGDYRVARAHAAEGMRLFRESGDRRGTGYSLAGFAILAAAQGDGVRAARLSGAVAALEEVLGTFLEAPLQFEYEQELAAVREGLDEEAFAAAVAEGRTMTMEEALAYSLDTANEGPRLQEKISREQM